MHLRISAVCEKRASWSIDFCMIGRLLRDPAIDALLGYPSEVQHNRLIVQHNWMRTPELWRKDVRNVLCSRRLLMNMIHCDKHKAVIIGPSGAPCLTVPWRQWLDPPHSGAQCCYLGWWIGLAFWSCSLLTHRSVICCCTLH